MKRILSVLAVLVLLVYALPCRAEGSGATVHLSSLDGLTLVDKISFDFTTEDSFVGVFANEVASIGDSVSGELEHYKTGSRHYYILTLSGSIDTMSLWSVNYDSLDNINVLSANIPMRFSTVNRVENEALIIYDGLPDTFSFKGIFESGNIKSVLVSYAEFSYNVVIDSSMSDAIECDNVKYEFIKTGEKVLSKEFEEKNKEELIKEQKTKDEIYDVPEQDSERYVTKVKGVRNDGKLMDYRINFIAEIPVDINGEYDAATLVGFTGMVDGNDTHNYTMIRLSGGKGGVWFKNANTEPRSLDGDVIIVDNSYDSLISFDGIQQVYNSVNHDILDTEITFKNDASMELVSIQLSIEGQTVTADVDDIKYIGGGKAAYEKLF